MTTQVPSMIIVRKFIEVHQLPLDLATGILKTEEDCMTFQESFYRSNRQPTDDLLDFREHKIQSANLTIGMFVDKCHNCNGSLRQVFEEVFIQDFTDSDIGMILTALIETEMTLESLYQQFMKNPNKNILRYVL